MTVTESFLQDHLSEAIEQVDFQKYKKVHSGKVRETFEKDGNRIIVTTDRQSAFDRILAAVPFKGQVLNRISAFWFEKMADISAHHLLAVPDPAVSVCRPARVFPVEFIIRGYMTGSTDTSVWKNYEKGVRSYCGIDLPEGMKKNDRFATPIITPTTKPETGHDELISAEEIIEQKLMTPEEWKEVSEKALAIFERGQKMAAEKGLLLVDTKFEFGRDLESGNIVLVDEVLTPDSSRYWLAESAEQRIVEGKEPESFDKEFLRLWFAENCDPYHDEILPEAPPELIARLAHKYILAFEKITGQEFVPQVGGSKRIEENLDAFFSS